MLWSRKLALTALVLLAALSVFGFFHERLFAQHMWSPDGARRFLLYTAVFWVAAGAILLWAPRWLGVVAAGFVLIYTAWWSGPAAPLAVLYFLGACFLTGRIFSRGADAATAVLLGLAAWMFAIWIALHFPVNTRLTYAAAMAIPYIWEARRLRMPTWGSAADQGVRPTPEAAVLLFVLLAHWLVALKPEVSADGISMHLALPMAVAHDGQWAFDLHRYAQAHDAGGRRLCFHGTGWEVLAGRRSSGASHELRFARSDGCGNGGPGISRQWLRLPTGHAFLVAALFASTPLVQLVTGSLFVENVWAAMILGASLAIARYREAA